MVFKISRTIIMGDNSPGCPCNKKVSCIHRSWQSTLGTKHQSLGTKRLFSEYKKNWIQNDKYIVALFYYIAIKSQQYSRCLGKSSIASTCQSVA